MELIKIKLVIGIAILGLATIIVGLNSGHLIIFLIGSIITVPSVIYFFYFFRIEKGSQIKEFNVLQNFKTNADKEHATIDSYEILSNNWTNEVDVNSKYSWLNDLAGYSDNNIRIEHHVTTTIKLVIKFLDKTEEYIDSFNKQPETLMMLLEMHKETTVYIDKNDPQKKYLDLEFLEN